MTEAIDGRSLNITDDRICQLRQLFPEVFTEGEIDYTRLRMVLGDVVADGRDRYGLSWTGRQEAFREIQKQTTCTLLPDREKSIDFDTTENVFIEGENLEVLRVLQKSYYTRVKMIYIDPPYNTGNDHFIYPDDFSERLEEYQKRAGIKDEEGYVNKQDLWRKNTRENGHFHSVWLSMMYPRLFLARNLLRDDGVIFVSIDDTEVANLRLLMDEVFGEENFVGQFIWKSRRSEDTRALNGLSTDHEYVLCYGKVQDARLRGSEKDLGKFSNPDNDPRGPWRSADLTGLATKDRRPNLHYDLVDPSTDMIYKCPDKGWRYDATTMASKVAEGRILFPASMEGRPRHKLFLNEMSSLFKNVSSVITDIATADGTREINELMGPAIFTFPKPTDLIQLFIQQAANDDGSIILDFFAGSGATAHAVLELNKEDGGTRKFICVQIPEPTEEKSEARKAGYETIADISRARIRKVIEKLNEEEEGKLELETPGDRGFRSYTLAPSNFKTWRALLDGGNVDDLLLEFRDAHKAEAEAGNMVTELLLKAGLPLTTPVEAVAVSAGTVYNVENGRLVIVLEVMDDAVRDWIISTAPQHVVCLDTVFADNDQLLTNLKLQLTEAGIELTVI